MIYRSISPGRSCAIIFVATTLFCLHPRSIAAQDLESKPASTDHAHLAPCSAVHGDELQPTREDLTGNSLSGAPIRQDRRKGKLRTPRPPSVSNRTNCRAASNPSFCMRILATNAPPAPTRYAEPSMRWRSPLSTRQIPAEVLSRRVTSLPLQRAVS
jgi:hypothetical protein